MSRQKNVSPEQKILTLLLEHTEYAQFQMEEKTGLSYKTIIDYLKKLEKTKMIKLSRTEPSTKGGKEKKFWSITSQGLTKILTDININQFEKAANKHPDLLLVFKKWHQIKQTGSVNLVWEKLQLSISLGGSLDDALFFSLLQALTVKTDQKFVELCKTDPEIKGFIESKTQAIEDDCRKGQASVFIIKSVIGESI